MSLVCPISKMFTDLAMSSFIASLTGTALVISVSIPLALCPAWIVSSASCDSANSTMSSKDQYILSWELEDFALPLNIMASKSLDNVARSDCSEKIRITCRLFAPVSVRNSTPGKNTISGALARRLSMRCLSIVK